MIEPSDLAKARAQLRSDEDEVLYAYQDHKGFWTIGIGILIDKARGGGLTPFESAWLIEHRMKGYVEELTAAYPWFEGLNGPRQSALLNMRHQLGARGLAGFKRMLEAVRDERWATAKIEALDSKWAREDSPGRAKRVATQLETGEWQY